LNTALAGKTSQPPISGAPPAPEDDEEEELDDEDEAPAPLLELLDELELLALPGGVAPPSAAPPPPPQASRATVTAMITIQDFHVRILIAPRVAAWVLPCHAPARSGQAVRRLARKASGLPAPRIRA
jgi:rhodanese-related sulfurtransferase